MSGIDVTRYKNKTIIRSEGLFLSFLKIYTRVGTIKFSKRFGAYYFYPNLFIDCMNRKVINIINKEMKRLEHKK